MFSFILSLAITVAPALAAETTFSYVQPLNTTILGSYGNSPPVYPSLPPLKLLAKTTGIGWEAGLIKAQAFLAELTPEEKAWLVTGTPGPCVGNIIAIPRLGFGGLCLQDGPLAIRQADFASVYPAGVSAAATWDRDLMYRRGVGMGAEFRGKGAHIALGPVAGPLGRSAYAGRNWEGHSPDPYLTGVAMQETITGLQSNGIQACAKHFIGNEQEEQRNPTFNGSEVIQEAVSANIADRTMHEMYLWPFAQSVHAGVASIMCSYNRVNGSYGCANSKTLNGLLKEELGFQGYVMTDWGANHVGVASIDAGLDMNMPGGLFMYGWNWGIPGSKAGKTWTTFGGNITEAINNGSLPASRLDDMVLRVMTPYFALGQDSNFPSVDPSAADLNNFTPRNTWFYDFDLNGTRSRDVRADHAKLIREIGAASAVLLKNTNGALPLKAPSSIAVFGNDAGDDALGSYNDINFEYGTLAVGGGSGTGRLTYLITPLEAIKRKAAETGALVQAWLNNTLITTTPKFFGTLAIPEPPSVCLVFVKTWAQEGGDRANLELNWDGAAVVERVASWCKNTIVIMHSSGIVNVPFSTHPNVTGIIAAHYPGQESGNAIVDVLYGDVNPSAKLPYTIANNVTDYNAPPTTAVATDGIDDWQSYFTEGLEVDYRYFDAKNLSVRFEFGFGLSYTTFALSNLSILNSNDKTSAIPPPTPIRPGGNPALWDTVVTINVTVANTGPVAGAAVPQLYITLPSSAPATPPRQLRGFSRVTIDVGGADIVTFELMRRDVSYWDVVVQDWIIPAGAIGVGVGFSSRDIKLEGQILLV